MSVPNTPENQSLLEGFSNLILGPVSLRRIFLLLTRLHYSDPAHYGEFKDKMSSFVWSQDDTKRKLFIDHDYNFRPTKLEQRPAIFVGTDAIMYRRVAIDNVRAITEDSSGKSSSYVAETGIIIRHISMTPDEALALGEMSAIFFSGVRALLKQHMKLHTFDIVKLDSTKPFLREAAEPDQQFSCDLVMKLAYVHDWTTIWESHRVKTVSIREAVAAYALPAGEQTVEQ